MTSQNFDARYQLLKCVAVADGIRTHNALELVTGRVVMVHLVDAAGPEEVEVLQRRLGRLPQTEKARVLEIATLPAGFAVVTEFLQGMTNFPEWLAARIPDDSIELPSLIPPGASQFPALRDTEPTPIVGAGAPPDSPLTDPPVPAPASVSAQEVSTIQLRRPAATDAAATVPAAAVAPKPAPIPSPPPPPEPPRPAAAPQGDFTRMFGAASATPMPTAPVPVPQKPTPQPPPLPAAVPAEPVASVLPPPVAMPVSPPAAPAAPVLREGEFTRMFRGGTSSPTPPHTPARRIENVPSPFAGGPPPGAPTPPPPPVLPPALLIPHTPIPPAKIPPPPASRPTIGSDDFFGSFPVAGSLPPAAAPYSPPPLAPPSSPSPIGATGRPAGLGASPIGVPPAASSAPPPLAMPPLSPPPATASPIGGSPMGLSGLPPLPPPPASAPMFPGGGGGAVSPLGAGRATPASRGGVYTELISRSVTPPPVPVIEKKQTPDVPVKKRSIPLGLIIVLNAVLILAIILIAYFAFRPKPVPAGQADSTAADSAAATDSGGKRGLSMPKAPTITKPTIPTVQKPTLPTVPKLK